MIAKAELVMQPPRPDGEQGGQLLSRHPFDEASDGRVQVLTRGPVHEAFAEPIAFDTEPGIVVTAPPPSPIDEVPPNERPMGVNVTWIPGYTAWDDERSDYIWVSGTWRSPPPGRQWIPGYWARVQQGYQWTAGFWADAELNEVEYLPEPPEAVESGPSGPPSSPDAGWIPGSWIWRDGRYLWRPGYWLDMQSDWDWIPSHYTWTPRGYVFVDGYWDYSVSRRGVLFAPVYFDAHQYRRRNYYYSPSTVISLAVFSDHLFVRPRYDHYYFGDYYDARYQNEGFYSRFAYQTSRRGYDPIFVQQRWANRRDSGWDVRIRSDFRHRREHIEARPPRTLTAQLTLRAGGSTLGERGLVVAASLGELVATESSAIRFKTVDDMERQRFAQRGKEIRTLGKERDTLEAEAGPASVRGALGRSAPVRVRLPRSPIMDRHSDAASRDGAPPTRHEMPEPDPKVEARPRKLRADAASSKSKTERRPDSASQGKRKVKSKKKP